MTRTLRARLGRLRAAEDRRLGAASHALFADRRDRGRPLVSAHRGAAVAGEEPDLEDYRRAIEAGVDFVEFDVRRTGDGVLVGCHDDRFAGRLIAESRFEDLVEPGGRALPRIEDIARLARGRTRLHVDLKERGTEEDVIDVLRRLAGPQRCVLTSLEDDVVREVKDRHPEFCVGLSLGRNRPANLVRTRTQELRPFRRARRCGADFLAVHYRLGDLGVLRQAARRRTPVFVWTVNDEARLSKALADHRVTAVVTDVPAVATRIADDLAASAGPEAPWTSR